MAATLPIFSCASDRLLPCVFVGCKCKHKPKWMKEREASEAECSNENESADKTKGNLEYGESVRIQWLFIKGIGWEVVVRSSIGIAIGWEAMSLGKFLIQNWIQFNATVGGESRAVIIKIIIMFMQWLSRGDHGDDGMNRKQMKENEWKKEIKARRKKKQTKRASVHWTLWKYSHLDIAIIKTMLFHFMGWYCLRSGSQPNGRTDGRMTGR